MRVALELVISEMVIVRVALAFAATNAIASAATARAARDRVADREQNVLFMMESSLLVCTHYTPPRTRRLPRFAQKFLTRLRTKVLPFVIGFAIMGA
jgi:hypothetical protein